MSIARAPRNTVLAGLFVVVCIALAVVCVVMLSNIRERLTPKNAYTVRFSILDGADGLDKGAAVKVGGKRVGRVRSAAFNPPEGEPHSIDIAIEIDRRITLYTDAQAMLVKPLLGSGSTINIITPGPGDGAGEVQKGGAQVARVPLQPGAVLVGTLGAPGFMAASDYAKFKGIIGRVDAIVGDVEPRIGPMLDDAHTAVKNVRDITASAKEQWPAWQEQVSTVLARIEKESKNFEGLGQSVSDGLREARELVDRGRQVIDENRPAIKDAIEQTRQFVEKVNKEAYDRILAAIADGQEAMHAARSAAQELDRLLAEKSPELSDIVTNAALGAQQLKLAMSEIRASPWRLLYQPTKKELENELLYNSVRQYATAVSELRYAAASLDAVSQRAATTTPPTPGATGSGTPVVDTETINRLTAKLQEAFDKYQREEREFLDRWVKTDR